MRAFGLMAACCVSLAWAQPAAADVLVRISKSDQRMSVSIDGAPTYNWPVSTGRNGWTTPGGDFRPYRLERTWFSRRFDSAPMPWSVFFHHGYAVHGTKEIHRLGNAASHGCVRLHPENAERLFNLVKERGYRNVRIVINDAPLSGARDVPVARLEPRMKREAANDSVIRLRGDVRSRDMNETRSAKNVKRYVRKNDRDLRPGQTIVREISREEFYRTQPRQEAAASPRRDRGFEW